MVFQRYLADYLPANGWSLEYAISGDTEAAPITFTSTALNEDHFIEVDPTTTVAWVPGEYVLRGYAVNTSGERHQIYYGELGIFPNGTAQDNVPVTTHAQRMIPLLEAALEQLAVMTVENSSIEEINLQRVKRMDLEKQLAINKEIRANEIGHDNVRSGKPSGFKIRTQLNVVGGPYPTYAQGGNLIP